MSAGIPDALRAGRGSRVAVCPAREENGAAADVQAMHPPPARLASAVAALSTALLLLAAAPSGAATTSIPKTCAALEGTNLVAGTMIKLVRLNLPSIPPRGSTLGEEDRTALFSCALPSGAVRRLATEGSGFLKGQAGQPVDGGSLRVGEAAGVLVTVIDTNGDLTGDTGLEGTVYNAATGRKLYRYANLTNAPGPTRTLLDPSGTLVELLPTEDASIVRVIAFSAAGTRQVLDSSPAADIPTSSLALLGTAVSWTDHGAAKSATIG